MFVPRYHSSQACTAATAINKGRRRIIQVRGGGDWRDMSHGIILTLIDVDLNACGLLHLLGILVVVEAYPLVGRGH
jgi:hypothetical protein